MLRNVVIRRSPGPASACARKQVGNAKPDDVDGLARVVPAAAALTGHRKLALVGIGGWLAGVGDLRGRESGPGRERGAKWP